ncbi:DNA methylase, adenine-specific [uncultured Caudovirales phage]|uniref:site-specific DNA-methyltransferase (adenine-specific) n=1 Tax=uncultured Caudovirales phage TaxID=2100421 RepID=A0A6J5KZC0_9CAUD|nr:DNA methylase, adenine-specific [uncultured Caudovirales phage]
MAKKKHEQDTDNIKLFLPYVLECVEEIANHHEKRNMDLTFYICEFYEELGKCLFSGCELERMPTKYRGIIKLIIKLSKIPSLDGYTFMGLSQYLLQYRLDKENDKWIIKNDGNESRKNLGSYYTPLPLVEQLCKSTLLPIADLLSKEGKLHEIKICEPTCGSGVFLVTALRWLAEKYRDHFPEEWKTSNLKAQIVKNCLYGVDINPYATLECQFNLCLECKEGVYFYPGANKNRNRR